MLQAIHELASLPWLCLGLTVFFFLFCFAALRGILGALLRMHRSKSAVKKIRKAYSFRKRLWYVHFEENCIHAVKFSKCLVWFGRIQCVACGLCLLVDLGAVLGLPVQVAAAWISVGIFVLLDVPLFFLFLLLARPFIGRFREFSFEKYHNTRDHESIL